MGVTVRQRQPGKGSPWWVFINHQGKRKAKKVGDKKTAEAVAAQIREKMILGELKIEEEKETPLFKDYAEEWLDAHARVYCKPSTAEDYETHIKKHLNPAFATKPINQIQRRDIKKFISSKLAENLSPKTVDNIRMCLSSILTGAVEDEIIPVNPALKLGRQIKKLPNHKENNSRVVNPFTKEEAQLFLETAYAYCPRYHPLFFCALRTGMREGEIIGLEPGDLDFHNRIIRVERAIVRNRVTTPKNGKVREVDMSRQLAKVLNAWLAQRKEEKLRKGWKESPGWLFYNENGNPIDPDNLRKRHFYKCLEKAGLRRIRFHDLRHTYASLLIVQGESLAYIKEQLGHQSIQTTVDIYGHLLPGSNKSAVDKLDDLDATGCNLYATNAISGTKKGPTTSVSP